MTRKQIHIVSGVCIAVFLLFSFIGGCSYRGSQEEKATVQYDTTYLVKRDTVSIEKPFEVVRYRTRTLTDTLRLISFVDQGDSSKKEAVVQIPIEQAQYAGKSILNTSDTLSYRASVSGYKAKLDSITFELSSRERQVTKTITKTKRWGVGIQAGAGVGYNGKVLFTPYIGIGISYNFWNF